MGCSAPDKTGDLTAEAVLFPLAHSRLTQGIIQGLQIKVLEEIRVKQSPVYCTTPFWSAGTWVLTCWLEACSEALSLSPSDQGEFWTFLQVEAVPLQGSKKTPHLVLRGPWISSLQGRDLLVV